MGKLSAKENEVIRILFTTPGVVNLSKRNDFEPQPGVFASVYINLKAPLAAPRTRKRLVYLLSQHIPSQTEYICGLESGGSYYASAVSDLLDKKLIFFRKTYKEYNASHQFVGLLPKKEDRVVIIDDVISSGNTANRAIKQLKKIGCEINVLVLFSYGWDQQIAKNLNISVTALSQVEELIDYGLRSKKMAKHNAKIVREWVKTEEDRLAGGKNG